MTYYIDVLSEKAYNNALQRGKTSEVIDHWEDYRSIRAELEEFCCAYEDKPSEHLPEYTQSTEELADIMIACMTELYKRNVKVSEIVMRKIQFNTKR